LSASLLFLKFRTLLQRYLRNLLEQSIHGKGAKYGDPQRDP
jgi:hypothetical protein